MINNINREDVQTYFGCNICWPSDPDLAWEARSKLEKILDLIDESHLHIMILACNSCNQRFISVFTEKIDWINGEDPMYWTLLPITDLEAIDLTQKQSPLTEADINALGPERRSLRRDYPSTVKEPYIFWGSGILVGPHD